jgi:hypothetical protein
MQLVCGSRISLPLALKPSSTMSSKLKGSQVEEPLQRALFWVVILWLIAGAGLVQRFG